MSAWELPTTVEVAGRSFAIRSDFRAVLDALAALTDPDLTQQEQYSVFFGGLSALALADDGAFVFEKVLEAVAPLVEEAHKAGIAAAEARLKKHTAVYADFSKGLAPGQQA